MKKMHKVRIAITYHPTGDPHASMVLLMMEGQVSITKKMEVQHLEARILLQWEKDD